MGVPASGLAPSLGGRTPDAGSRADMQRYLAIDHGARRIGLAVGDSQTRLATPIPKVLTGASEEDDVSAIGHICAEYGAEELVVGLPLNMDGTEGPQARRVRSFAARLAGTLGKPVHFWDERLSSRAADEKLRPAELSRKKRHARSDSVAAQTILQEFLDSLPPPTAVSGSEVPRP